VPIFIWQDKITAASALLSLYLAPGILIGAFLGKRIYDRIPQRAFEIVVLGFTIIAGISLLIPR